MAGKWTRRLLKAAGYGAGVLVVVLAAGVTLTVGWRPIIGPKARALTSRRFEPTQARLERGKYLTENVSGCFACHSRLNLEDPASSYPPAQKGGGSTLEADGLPWLSAPNITPDPETGAGLWTDDQLARAIREGIGHDGRALFPMMPYQNFRHMSDEDLASVIVYLRTIEPVRNTPPKSRIPFPLSWLKNNAPEPLTESVPQPDKTDTLKYGEYMIRMGDCSTCHTPRDAQGQPLPGMDFGGGTPLGDGSVVSANLTPDPTGISYYDEALFIRTIRTGHVGGRKLSPAMPWWIYRGIKEEDLKAMFAYLRTLKPVEHRVDNTEPPTFCKICKQKHGLGERN